MDAEPDALQAPRSRRPQWRWLYGGGVWAVLMTGAADLTGLNDAIATQSSPAGHLTTSGRMILGTALAASMVLGFVVQRQWPSSLAYRLFAPAVALVVVCLLFVLPFGETYFDGEHFVGVGMFLAWIAGVVLADPAARIRPPGLAAPDGRASASTS